MAKKSYPPCGMATLFNLNVSANYMTTHLDDNLRIQLLSYDKPDELTERYYFLEMSTLKVTFLLPQDLKIIEIKLVSCTVDNNYLDDQTISRFNTVKNFNEFFVNNMDYYIHDCEIKFDNNLILGSHDDGEVTIQFPLDHVDKSLLEKISKKYNLDRGLFESIKKKPGYYFTIDEKNLITGEFKTFDDFLKYSRG